MASVFQLPNTGSLCKLRMLKWSQRDLRIKVSFQPNDMNSTKKRIDWLDKDSLSPRAPVSRLSTHQAREIYVYSNDARKCCRRMLDLRS